ncbi:PaaI family thioesterase [Nocardia sp. CDC159]|uniref:Acyl-coenzyme A thioesterase THEM4 n=1 Tax=Nocardia pulmonis TaxID=2951408 RepID=A0A9X2EA36_9NOCA|nr:MULTISPECIES: PaaI family thioesterase [Nocardia]MCM6776420.1 PaaI family thioesterase [Nocardia pulmonis]MCM6788844.1 PaaI family thioesterase [Nocardia sp. CDC159]
MTSLLPHHQPHCLGCGPANASGLGIEFVRDGDGIRGVLSLDRRHEGAPGLAHGGAVAAILDEAAGTALLPLRLPAVTAQLNVSFAQPVPLGRELTVRSRLDRRDGRKLHISAVLELDGRVAARAEALFVEVAAEHFHAHGAAPGDLPALGI